MLTMWVKRILALLTTANVEVQEIKSGYQGSVKEVMREVVSKSQEREENRVRTDLSRAHNV